jgi:hypothetical protein
MSKSLASIQIPPDVAQALAAEARARGVPDDELVVMVLRKFLYRRRNEKALTKAGQDLAKWQDENSDVVDTFEDIATCRR